MLDAPPSQVAYLWLMSQDFLRGIETTAYNVYLKIAIFLTNNKYPDQSDYSKLHVVIILQKNCHIR
jgi:hypothetical protein